MSSPTIYPSTSQFSNYKLLEACDLFQTAQPEGFGNCSLDHIQLCPQTPDVYSESLLDEIQQKFPNTKFRLHANIRVKTGVQFIDASSYSKETHWYFERISELSNHINAPLYSLHAGLRDKCTMKQLFQNAECIQSIFDVPALIEGMYPTPDNKYLVSTWKEYQILKDSGLPYAVDLSHLNIVGCTEGYNTDMIYDLIAHENCLEIHISHNSGKADSHRPISKTQWQELWWKESWLAALQHRSQIPQHFTEGLQKSLSHRFYSQKFQ